MSSHPDDLGARDDVLESGDAAGGSSLHGGSHRSRLRARGGRGDADSATPGPPAKPAPEIARALRRYELVSADGERSLESFAQAVAAGLSQRPRSLPCRFLYDARGSELFEDICELDDYYPTRAERSILLQRADELAARFDERASLVELGSGSASKTQLLIEAFLRRQGELVFVPIDISRAALEESARRLLDDHPTLRIRAVEGEYERGLELIRRGSREPRLLLWLGSSIGNLDRPTAAGFLARVRAAMAPEERLLVGVDLRKDPAVLERAYDDGEGVTAAFNLNLLERINRELGGDFDVRRFRHRAVWNPEPGRVEMHLESSADQDVRVEALDLDLHFGAGERIHTESSYKYSFDEIDDLARRAGLAVESRWLDDDGLFSLNWMAPVPR